MLHDQIEALEPRWLFNSGAIDNGFGYVGHAGGFVTVDEFEISDVAVQPTRATVVVGTHTFSDEEGTISWARLVRLLGNGKQDSTLAGVNGALYISAGGMNSATAVEALPDGSILVAGQRDGQVAILAKLNRLGHGVRSFDPHGHGAIYLGPLSEIDDILVQSDGKILVAGRSIVGGDAAILRINTDGTIDQTFGVNGIVTPAGSTGFDGAVAIAIDSQGRIVAEGSDVNVWRFSPDGAPDAQFADDGVLIVRPVSDEARARGLGVLSDDSIVVLSAGTLNTRSNYQKGELAKFDSSGSADATFGTAGVAQLPPTLFERGTHDEQARSLYVESDGKFIVGGFVSSNPDNDAGLSARFNTDGSLDTSFGESGFLSAGPMLAPAPDNSVVAASRNTTASGFIASRITLDDLPVISLTGRNVDSPSTSSALLLVRLIDSDGIDTSTFGNQNIYVSGKNGYLQFARLDSFSTSAGGTQVDLRYKVPPPGGSWDSGDNGDFDVVALANQFLDLTGHSVRNEVFGKLGVLIHPTA